MARIVGDGSDEKKRTIVEAVQWEIAARALTLGVDDIRLHFLDVPREELLRRLELRNLTLPLDSTFRVDASQLDLWSSWFEPPTPDEIE